MPAPSVDFSPDKLYEMVEVGLPQQYAADMGEDLYNRQRPFRVRGDMADFLRSVRAVNAKRADQLGWKLQAYPFVVCIAARRVDGGFKGYQARADEILRSGIESANALGVDVAPRGSPTTDLLLRFAVEEARRRFCPAHGRAVGDPLGVLPGWDTHHNGYVDLKDTAVPWYAFSNPDLTENAARFTVAAIYLATAASPDLVDWGIDLVEAQALFCSKRDEYLQQARPPTFERDPEVALTMESVRSVLAGTLASQATVELACPPDWLDL